MWMLLACTCGDVPEAPLGHYASALLARDALIRGDLEGVQDAARQLDQGGTSDSGASELGGAVGMAVAASDTEEAGWAVAGMITACAECHDGKTGPTSASPGPHGLDALWADLVSGRPIDASGVTAVAPTEGTALTLASGHSEKAEAYVALVARCSSCHP